ncbi:MAG: polysaccharide biosynthesis tyrosine autokinase [Gammaproteobacteria bacterium]
MSGPERPTSPRSGSGSGWAPSAPAVMAEEEGMDLREIAAVFWNGKWIIAGITAIVLALALIYAFLATPIYQANALIQIQEQQNQQLGGASADVFSMLLPTAAPAQTEIAIMESRSVIEPTIKKEHLDIIVDDGDPPYSGSHADPKVRIASLAVPDDWVDKDLKLVPEGGGDYKLLSPSGKTLLEGKVGETASTRGGAVKILVTRLDVPKGGGFPVKRVYDQEAVESLNNNFSAVEQGNDTGIVSLTLQGPHPVQTRNILNTLLNQYIRQNVAAQASQARQSLVFINKQLPKVNHTLNTAESELTKYRTEKGVVNLDAQAKSLLQSLTGLESQLTQIKLTQSSMQQRFTGNYPGLQALQGQTQDINNEINAVKSQIGNLPGKEKEYVSLLQKVQVYQQLYTALLSKSQDLQIAEAATTGSARIVDYAVTPIKPIAPRKALIGGLGLILGLFLGIVFVFLRRALTRSVRDASELENEFGLPVYAVVPHSDRQANLAKKAKSKRHGLIPVLAVADPEDPAVESVRSLRTSVNFALKDAERKIITMGGCMPGIGKSFLSINLAHVLGASGARVLLVDADLRRGHLEKYMRGQKQPGLSQLLSGDVELEEAVQASPHEDNVDFLPSGPFPANPYELISTPRLEDVLARCAADYDYVVIDVPPILSVAEGLIISRFATMNFLVVKAGEQTLRELRVALDRMQQNGVRLAGFIFNDLSRQAASYTYGRYAKRYYYSRYADGGGK